MQLGNSFLKKQNYYIYYTAFFAVMMFIVSIPLMIEGKSFVWELDALPLHTTNTIYFSDFIKSIFSNPSGSVDFTIGMGMDPLMWLSTWYTEPLNILSLFFSAKSVEILYCALIVVRFYLTGLAFSIFCRHMKRSNYETLFGALMYAFCGYAVFAGMRHPIFLIALIYLPLLLVTMDKVLEHKSALPFVLMVFISAATNYYFMYMNTLLMVVYFVARYFGFKKDNGNKPFKFWISAIRVIVFYLIGIGMAAIVLIPSILCFLDSARTTSVISVSSMLFYDFSRYFKIFTVLIVPAMSAGFWIRINLAAIAFIAVVFLFARKKNPSFLKYSFFILTMFLMLPVFAFVFSGFSSVTNRWCYGYAFLVAFLTAVLLKDLLNIDKRELKIILIASCVFIPIAFVNNYTLVGFIELLLFLSIVVLNYFRKISSNSAKILLFAVLIINITVNSFMLFSSTSYNYSGEFLKAGSLYERLYASETEKFTKELAPKDGEFYRFDYQNADYKNGNRAILEGYYGLSSTFSVYSKYFVNYSKLLDNAGLEATNCFWSFDNRMTLNSLAGVKYILGNGKTDVIPYGYELVSKDDSCAVYENKNSQSIGCLYTEYMTEKDFNKLSTLDKQEALLTSVILPSEVGYLNNNRVAKADYSVFVASGEHDDIADNIADDIADDIVIKRGESVRLNFTGVPNTENYLHINYLKENKIDSDKIYPTILTSDNALSKFAVTATDGTYTLGRTSYTVCLGYSENGIAYCDLGLPLDAHLDKISVKLSDIELWCLSVSSYKTAMDKFSQNKYTKIDIKSNNITFTSDTIESGILSLNIPYSEGWSAKVDGIETDLIRTNIIYTGLYLNSGSHKIELSYHTPGLYAGYWVSGISLFVFITILPYYISKSRKNREI